MTILLPIFFALAAPAMVSSDEARIEARSEAFSAQLDAASARIDAITMQRAPVAKRLAAVDRELARLQPTIEAYARDVVADFALLAGDQPASADEYRGYGVSLSRYVRGVPAELRRGALRSMTAD